MNIVVIARVNTVLSIIIGSSLPLFGTDRGDKVITVMPYARLQGRVDATRDIMEKV